MSKKGFVNLDVASAFSFLWGSFTPEELVKRAKRLGHKAVALTDLWGMYGIARFWKACRASGIQPITGARIEICGQGWAVLLAMDRKGYGNICRILSSGLMHKAGKRIPVSSSILRSLAEGVVCITGVEGSEVRTLARRGDKEAAGIKLLAMKDIFRSAGRLVMGIQNNQATDPAANMILIDIANSTGIMTAAVNHAAFLDPGDYQIHKILCLIQKKHHHRKLTPLPNQSYHLCSYMDMKERLDNDTLAENTLEIARLCTGFSFPPGKLHPPSFQEKKRADTELAQKAIRALAAKMDIVPGKYILLLDRELQIVKKKGLSDFFLLVHQICSFAEKRGIRSSIRGSAAGSLLVHLLHGGPDPVTNSLLFERFINEGRGDLPDIDIDFDSERRDEITRWLMERFCSPMRAALVATIQKFRVRSAVRLAAKAMGYPISRIDTLSRCLPWSLRSIPLKEAVERLPELKNSPLRRETTLLETASCIEGLPFQASVHLGGVILTPDHVNDWTCVSMSRKGFPVAHLDKDDIEILGLLKLDLLGLRMHTAIEKALQILRQQGIEPDLENIPLDDEKTFELLCSGKTLGIFQVESSGQRNLIGRLQPGSFNDIVAEISLFRPGPVKGDMVNKYVRRKNGLEPTEVLHPDLQDILAETYGVIVFQEQVLRIVRRFTGLSYSDADAFRRAMTKGRSKNEMKMLKNTFIQGALKKGHDRKTAELVYKKIAAFAAYGFCKAHAVSFARITWQSAWLKAHHPAAFYAGLLNAGNVGSYPPFVILNEARRVGIPVLPPHVNRSGHGYCLEGDAIRCPLRVIRGTGPETEHRILHERYAGGWFQTWDDFFSRVQIPLHTRHMLILSGALDGLSGFEQEGICSQASTTFSSIQSTKSMSSCHRPYISSPGKHIQING
ncbi:MAG: hypothetical protein DSZ23_06135 [Thermodesulfatator sp.]|nr:MAG: hypothetical protein DSZ23_06135 [Thermodesulfatator sp.]